MSISKRVKSPVAKPQGHGEEENFPSESSEELDKVEEIDNPKVIDKAIQTIRTGKVTLKESVGDRVRLHLQDSSGKKFNIWFSPLDES